MSDPKEGHDDLISGQDERNIGFFHIDNEVLDNYALTPYSFMLYGILVRFVNKKKGYAFPSTQTIATKMKSSRPTVSKTIKELEEKKLIRVERSRAGNHYFILAVVKEVYNGCKGGLQPVVKEVYTKKTKVKRQSKDSSSSNEKKESKDTKPVVTQNANTEEKAESEEVVLVKELLIGKNGNVPPPKTKTREDLIFEIICIGSFGKRYEHISGQAGRAAKIRKALLKQSPDLTAEELEAAYRYYAKENPEFVKTSSKRLKTIDTILDWIEQAKDAAPPKVRSITEIKADPKWIDWHTAYAALLDYTDSHDLTKTLALSLSSIQAEILLHKDKLVLKPYQALINSIKSEVVS